MRGAGAGGDRKGNGGAEGGGNGAEGRGRGGRSEGGRGGDEAEGGEGGKGRCPFVWEEGGRAWGVQNQRAACGRAGARDGCGPSLARKAALAY